MYRVIRTIILSIVICANLISQEHNNTWYFSDGLGLDHNFFPPTVLYDGGLPSFNEGVSTYSDEFGNLLFYSNGQHIWNRHHQIMPNGSNVGYDRSSTQGVLFVQKPGSENLVYIFTVSSGDGTNPNQHILQYSILNLNLDGGLGDIIPDSKATILGDEYSEKIIGINTSCATVWILTHKVYSNEIHAWPITLGGIQMPVVSNVIRNDFIINQDYEGFRGAMKSNTTGDRIAFCLRSVSKSNSDLEGSLIGIFSFDTTTGVAKDWKTISDDLSSLSHGITRNSKGYFNCAFSPDGNYLYTIEEDTTNRSRSNLVQFDVNTKCKEIIEGYARSGSTPYGIQNSPNNEVIYVGIIGDKSIGAILEPNKKGKECGYNRDFIFLKGKEYKKGLFQNNVMIPNEAIEYEPLPSDTTLCKGETLTINLSAYVDHEWSDGSREAIRRIDSAGTYMVSIETDQGCLVQDSTTVRYYTEAEVLQDTTLCAVSDAQECRNRIWNFRDRSGIEFLDNGEIVNISNNLPFFMESSSTVSDCSGLLFYANAETIWNKNHEVMDNGDSLGGHWSASQGISIIQHPIEKSKFYVFTLGSNPISNLYYSIVDLNENNGLGKVIEKKIFLHSDLTEKMVAVKGPCNTAWLITHENNSDRFVVFSFGNEGINSPQYYSVGLPAITFSELDRFGNVPTGKLRISYDGKYLIHASFLFTIELFSFDPETGRLSDPIIIQSNKLDRQYYGSYSAIISPKNKYIYTNERIGRSDNTTIARYQISDQGDIHSTREVVYKGSFNDMHPFPTDLMISPFGTILISGLDNIYLSVIEKPDEPLNDIQFELKYHKLDKEMREGISGLHEPPIYFDDTIEENPILLTDTILCLGDHITIDLSAYRGHDWSDGSREAIRRIDSVGTYMVRIETDQGCLIQDSIKISYTDEGDMLRDTSLCPGSELLLDLRAYEEVLWSDGSEESLRLLTDEGSYRVSLMTAQGCLVEDSITISYIDTESLDLGADESLCADEAIKLIAPVGSESYIWSTGEETSSITVTEPGYYYLTVVQSGCMVTDSIMISRSKECHTDCNIYIPNAIKLNSSLGNERLSPVSNCTLSDYQMDIYDRWGGLLYRSLSPEYAWDGTTSGQQVNSGVYLYRLSYRYPDAPQSEYRTGSIMVYR